jgi:autotransporter strand-loop-strand O-heptosyltransferase
MFIGLGSGLSWVSWALGKKTVLISGFSRPNCEMTDCERIFVNDTLNTCNGCFNDFRLDPADWNWCPRHKGTSRQFECTKSIKPNTVIEKLSKFI